MTKSRRKELEAMTPSELDREWTRNSYWYKQIERSEDPDEETQWHLDQLQEENVLIEHLLFFKKVA